MLVRTVLVVGVIAGGLSAAAVAQQDVIRARKDLMGSVAKVFYGTLNRTQRGQTPYDQNAVDGALASLARDMPNLAKLVPPESKPTTPSSDYDASPKIWQNKADFDAKLANMSKVLDESKGKAKDVASLKVVVQNISNACDACHENYRVKTR